MRTESCEARCVTKDDVCKQAVCVYVSSHRGKSLQREVTQRLGLQGGAEWQEADWPLHWNLKPLNWTGRLNRQSGECKCADYNLAGSCRGSARLPQREGAATRPMMDEKLHQLWLLSPRQVEWPAACKQVRMGIKGPQGRDVKDPSQQWWVSDQELF